ncbi:MAG: hypothetical protein IPF52_14325 [Saprospiraceae bacterium]|nr:hypothetical protein [Saprospiraceae bacterium]
MPVPAIFGNWHWALSSKVVVNNNRGYSSKIAGRRLQVSTDFGLAVKDVTEETKILSDPSGLDTTILPLNSCSLSSLQTKL